MTLLILQVSFGAVVGGFALLVAVFILLCIIIGIAESNTCAWEEVPLEKEFRREQ